MATEWIKETAAQVLPHLVQCARLGETIVYGQLAKKRPGMRHHRPLPNVLCYIRDEICIPRGLPRLSVIVVNKNCDFQAKTTWKMELGVYRKKDTLHGFMKKGMRFAYKGWKELLANMGLQPFGINAARIKQRLKR